MKVFTHTFGCRVNQCETDHIRDKLIAGGHGCVASWDEADLCLVNTCSVTRRADRDALRMVRKISRDNPDVRLIVTGCLATRAPEEVLRVAPRALLMGNDAKDLIPSKLGCEGDGPVSPSARTRTRAFVKVQDGCTMRCTYCIVPSLRGRPWSRPADEVEGEVRSLAAAGYREIVLCGVRLGRYLAAGSKRTDFVQLLRRLLSLDGEFRIRLSSFEITDVTDRFLGLYREFPGRLCPYLHVPLQSGSDAVLKRMGRWYATRFFRRRVEAARAAVPGLTLFSDVMVGFPGETEAEYRETRRFVKTIGFSGLHVFRFSAREGTPAAALKAVPSGTAERRSREMRALDLELRKGFAEQELGKCRTVLAEKPREGLTEHFLRVRLTRPCKTGSLVRARIVSAGPGTPSAQPMPSSRT